MRYAVRYIAVGIVLTTVALLIALGISAFAGFDWLLAASISLVVAGAVALMLTFMPAPTTDGARAWTQFSDARGEGFNLVGSSMTGGRTGTDQEPPAWNTQAAVNSALPLLVAAVLLAIWFTG